jgi:hypothetical protein
MKKSYCKTVQNQRWRMTLVLVLMLMLAPV